MFLTTLFGKPYENEIELNRLVQSSEGDKENKSPAVKDINMKDIKSENENSQSVSDEDLNFLLRKFKSFITEKTRSKFKKQSKKDQILCQHASGVKSNAT